MCKKISEWHISDYIKTDKDVRNLLEAEREPYETALRAALIVLGDIAEMTDSEVKISVPRYYAKRWRRVIINRLKKEGIPDPTKLKDTQCEKSTLE